MNLKDKIVLFWNLSSILFLICHNSVTIDINLEKEAFKILKSVEKVNSQDSESNLKETRISLEKLGKIFEAHLRNQEKEFL